MMSKSRVSNVNVKFVKLYNNIINYMNCYDITISKRYAYIVSAMYAAHTRFIIHDELDFRENNREVLVKLGLQSALADSSLGYLIDSVNDGLGKYITQFYDSFVALEAFYKKDHFCEFVGYVVDRYLASKHEYETMSKELICYISNIIKQKNCKTIYNPFCGDPYIGVTLGEEIEYYGQVPDKTLAFVSNILLDSQNCAQSKVDTVDPLSDWTWQDFDCIVSLPPFDTHEIKDYFNALYHYMENYIFGDSDEGPKLLISIVPISFLSASQFEDARAHISSCAYRLDVVKLPSGVLNNTSIPVAMIIIYRGEEEDGYVHFIDGRNCVDPVHIEGISDRAGLTKLNVSQLHSIYNNENDSCHLKLDIGEVAEEDLLLSEVYTSGDVVASEGEYVASFDDLFVYDTNTKRIEGQHEVLCRKNFADNLYDISVNANIKEYISKGANVQEVHGPHLVFMKSDNKLLLYKHAEDSDFYINGAQLAFKVNPNVDMDYLCHLLLNSKHFMSMLAAFSRPMLTTGDLKLLSRIKFSVCSEIIQQREIVKSDIQKEYAYREQERNAERERLGMKEVSSDIAHILGTAFSNQKSIEACLRRYDPTSDKYKNAVSKLLDIMNYVQRTVVNFGNDIKTSSFRFKDVNIVEFIRSYVNAWTNFGAKCYKVSIDDAQVDQDLLVTADKDSLMIMLDTVFDNAYRHGFLKQLSDKNVVKITLSPVQVTGNSFCMISFANNGRPMPGGFTDRDYITKGRYSATSGRSGLGGYHIYSIAKGNKGYLGIQSSKDYPFIVNVLLPIAEDSKAKSNLLCSSYDGKLL